MNSLTFVEPGDLNLDAWKPNEEDYLEFAKELQEEIDYYSSPEGQKYYGESANELKADVEKFLSEFKSADSEGKAKIIRDYYSFLVEVCPVESYSNLFKKVLGLEE